MKIFRVENKDGFGPFTTIHAGFSTASCIWFEESQKHEDDPYNYPSIGNEGIDWDSLDYFRENYAVGCDSLEQLAYWFYNTRILKALSDLGFSITEYDVPDSVCEYGNSLKQVAFPLFLMDGRRNYPEKKHDIFTLIDYQETQNG